jgi:hypothetical protein
MLKQIFKKSVPLELLFNLLEKICEKFDTYYFIDLNAYKKMIFHEYHIDFRKELLNY